LLGGYYLHQEYSDADNRNNYDSDISTTASNCSPKTRSQKILIAEDETDIATLYKTALEIRNHQPTITTNGEDCLKVYHEDYQNNRFATEKETCSQPGLIKITNNRQFDVVLLDCNMPCINGIEVAKEILAVNPHQRIIFASAYVKDTVTDSIINLKQLKECIQKPFGMQELVDLIEDKRIYEELQRHNVDLDVIKALNPSHEQIVDLLDRLQNV
jgi:CheY-like chemotaxis protein